MVCFIDHIVRFVAGSIVGRHIATEPFFLMAQLLGTGSHGDGKKRRQTLAARPSLRLHPPRQSSLDVHCIVDNYGSSHKHPKVKAWLAAKPRRHMRFIPTYSSWLKQVKRFFALITDKAVRRGSFESVKQLITRIDQFVSQYEDCKPFTWTASADSILEKLHRLCSRISGTGHWMALIRSRDS
jgi:transposase